MNCPHCGREIEVQQNRAAKSGESEISMTHTIQRLKMTENLPERPQDDSGGYLTTPPTLKTPPMTYKQRQRQLYRIGKGWLSTCTPPRLLPGPTTIRESMLAIGRAEHWLYSRRAIGLPIDKSESERAFKIRMRLEAAS